MATIHISEAEAARDLAGLLAKVRRGEDVLILAEHAPAVRIHADLPHRRTLGQALALLTNAAGHDDDEFHRDAAEAHGVINQPLSDPWA